MQHYHKRLVEFEAEAFSLGKQTGQSVLEANIFDTGYTSLGAAYDKIDEYLPGIKLKEFIETHYLKFPPNLHPEQQFTPISCFYLTIVQHRYMYQLFEMLIKEYEKARASMTLMTSTSPFNTLYDIMKFYTIKINHHFGICSRISNDQNKAILRKIYSNKPFSDMNNNYNYQSPPKNWTGPDPVQNIISLLDDDAVICQIDFYTEQFQNLMLQYRKVSKMAFDDLTSIKKARRSDNQLSTDHSHVNYPRERQQRYQNQHMKNNTANNISHNRRNYKNEFPRASTKDKFRNGRFSK